jgi:hypothetical protein
MNTDEVDSNAAATVSCGEVTKTVSAADRWRGASHTARVWDQVRFGGEADLFVGPPEGATDSCGPSNPTKGISGPLTPSAPSKSAMLAKATKSFSRRLADVAQTISLISPTPVAETTSRLSTVGTATTNAQTELQQRTQRGFLQRLVADYVSYVLATSEKVFQHHVWQRMPHEPPEALSLAASSQPVMSSPVVVKVTDTKVAQLKESSWFLFRSQEESCTFHCSHKGECFVRRLSIGTTAPPNQSHNTDCRIWLHCSGADYRAICIGHGDSEAQWDCVSRRVRTLLRIPRY